MVSQARLVDCLCLDARYSSMPSDFLQKQFHPLDYNNSTIYYCSTTHGQSLVGTIYLVASVLPIIAQMKSIDFVSALFIHYHFAHIQPNTECKVNPLECYCSFTKGMSFWVLVNSLNGFMVFTYFHSLHFIFYFQLIFLFNFFSTNYILTQTQFSYYLPQFTPLTFFLLSPPTLALHIVFASSLLLQLFFNGLLFIFLVYIYILFSNLFTLLCLD